MDTKTLLLQNKRLIGILVAITLLLLVPAVTGAPWDLTDYIVGGALLLGTGLLFELAARMRPRGVYKAAAGIALGAMLLLTWVNLAVGIIGSEDNPVNLMYFGVVAIAFVGAGISRLRPRGLAYTMFATALAQFLVPFIAMAINRPPFSPGVVAVIGLNTVFALFFAGSGLLFRHAADTAPSNHEIP